MWLVFWNIVIIIIIIIIIITGPPTDSVMGPD